MALTPKQTLFVAEYLANGLNATQAYVAAGYAPKDAAVSSCQLLRNPKVVEEIERLQKPRLDRLGITAERVLEEIAKLAFHDPRKFFNADGSAKQVTELDDDTAMALAGMEVVELFEGNGDQKHAYGLSKKFKLCDKGQNLERLGRHFKLFTDKTEHSGKVVIERVLIPERISTKPSATVTEPTFGDI